MAGVEPVDLFNEMKQRFLSFKKNKYMKDLELYEKLATGQAPKWILHDWSDEDCIKILQQCKQAIMRNGKQQVGKVIIIDMVRENKNRDESSIETQLFFDMELMVTVNGMERNDKEWAKLFFDAGFLNYKIHPVLGTRALIELYP